MDLTWHATPVVIFTYVVPVFLSQSPLKQGSVMEINTGIIVSCMPTFPAFIQDIRHQFTRSRKGSQKLRSTSHKSRSTSQRHRSRHPSSKTSRQLHQQKKVPDQSTPSTDKYALPERPSNNQISPVELEANPVQIVEVHCEPRSYFSDESSEFEEAQYQYPRREAHESY
ncbi:MAG: hypothetical protein LQ352_008295, partial [Teloschistes flavicans]